MNNSKVQRKYFVPSFYEAEYGPDRYEPGYGEIKDLEDQGIPGLIGIDEGQYLVFESLVGAVSYVCNRTYYVSKCMNEDDMYQNYGKSNQMIYGDVVLADRDFCWEGGDSRLYQTPQVADVLCGPGCPQLLRFAISRATPERSQKLKAVFDQLPVEIQNTPPACEDPDCHYV